MPYRIITKKRKLYAPRSKSQIANCAPADRIGTAYSRVLVDPAGVEVCTVAVKNTTAARRLLR